MDNYSHANSIYTTSAGHALWIGDIQAAETISWLKEKSVKTVITAATGFKLQYDHSIKHIEYQLVDTKNQGISQYFDIAAYQIMKCTDSLQQGLKVGSVLVHCGAGVSRSPSLAIAFLIRYQNMTFKEALKHCKAKRPQVCPNLGFELQLKAYEHKRSQMNKISSVSLQSSLSKHREKVFPHIYQSQGQSNLMNKTGLNLRMGRQTHFKNHSNVSTHMEKDSDRERELEWLKKLAEFRFGATNMRKWRINGHPLKLNDLNSSKQSD